MKSHKHTTSSFDPWFVLWGCRPATTQNKKRPHNLLIVAVILACLAILGAVSPAIAQEEGPNAGLISEQSGLQINDISLSGTGIDLFVSLPPDMDQATFLERLLDAMILALNEVPNADHLTIHLYFLDQPYGVLEVPAGQVRRIEAGMIDGETFLDSLEFMDQRSPELQMRDTLSEMGLDLTGLSVTADEVIVTYVTEPYSDKLDLFDNWQIVLNLVANLFPTVQRTSIYIVVPENQTALTVQIDMRDYQSYQNDEINLLEFITRIETSYASPQARQAVEVQTEPFQENSGGSNLWMILCGGGLFLLSLVAAGIGLFLIVSKKAQKWGLILLVVLALPACAIGSLLFVIRLFM